MQWSSWKTHLIKHRRDGEFECPKCNKIFPRKGTLKLHLKRHMEVRQYKCHLCPKEFKTGSDLKTHLNIHTGKLKRTPRS